MPTRVAVDIGGTFTDLVHLDEETGDVGLAKAATTPAAFEEGVLDTVGQTELRRRRVPGARHDRGHQRAHGAQGRPRRR